MTKHTPGPWQVASEATATILGPSPTGLRIIAVAEEPNQTANAKLIAAAPELLEALRAACNDIQLLVPLAQSTETTLTDKGAAETRSHVALYLAVIAKSIEGGVR
jgi:hypothetical protein